MIVDRLIYHPALWDVHRMSSSTVIAVRQSALHVALSAVTLLPYGAATAVAAAV